MKGFGKPVVFNWNVTAHCHHSCAFCGNASRLSLENRISLEDSIARVHFIAENGIRHVWFSGGEPFLRRDFSEILAAAFDQNLKIGIITTGTVLNDKNISLLANHVEQIDHLNISIHGHTRDLYRAIHGVDQFDKVMGNLNRLNKAGIPFNIALVLQRINISYAKEICITLSRKKPHRISLLPLRLVGGGLKIPNHQLDYVELVALLLDLDQLRLQGEVVSINYTTKPITAPLLEHLLPYLTIQSDSCSAHAVLHMDSDGKMRICTHLADLNLSEKEIDSFTVDAEDGVGLEEVWNSEAFQKFRKNMYVGSLHDFCKNCPSLSAGKCLPCSFQKPKCEEELVVLREFSNFTHKRNRSQMHFRHLC